MKKKIIIGLTLFINLWSVNAQSDYREGYIINNQKDTIFGLINYKSIKNSALECEFKKNENAEKQIFSPQEIKAYKFINSKYFVSKIIEKDEDKIHIFLEYLINGVLDMYFFRDENGDHYYVGNEEGKLMELRNNEKKIVVDGKTYIKKSDEYVRVLRYTFKKSPSIVKKIDNVDLDHKSLIKITRDYHNELCTTGEECIVYEKKEIKKKSAFGISVGLNVIVPFEIEVRSYSSYLENDEFGYEYYPEIGIFYKRNFPFINERLFLYLNGAYQKVSFTENSITDDPVDGAYYNEYSMMDLHKISILGAFRYEFPKGKIRPVIEMGFSYTTSINSVEYNHNVYDYTENGKELRFNKNNVENFSYTSLDLGVGCNLKYLKDNDVSLMLRYQHGTLSSHRVFVWQPYIGVFKLNAAFELF